MYGLITLFAEFLEVCIKNIFFIFENLCTNFEGVIIFEKKFRTVFAFIDTLG